MDSHHLASLWREILIEIGENPDREGLKDTPCRIAKMYSELFKGYNGAPPRVTTFDNGNDGIIYDEMILDEGDFYSQCEHHVIPFFGQYYFCYIPNPKGKILGLSKVARVVDYFSSKLQIQERLVKEVVDYLWNELSKNSHPPLGMGLIIKGEHLCKTMRGARKKGLMTCSYLKGKLKTDTQARNEFLMLTR